MHAPLVDEALAETRGLFYSLWMLIGVDLNFRYENSIHQNARGGKRLYYGR